MNVLSMFHGNLSILIFRIVDIILAWFWHYNEGQGSILFIHALGMMNIYSNKENVVIGLSGYLVVDQCVGLEENLTW